MRFLIPLFLTCLSGWALDSRHTYVTPEELQGFGDFNGDGLLDALVIDRGTGFQRIGTAAADGSLAWQTARATGCPAAEALAVGPIASAAIGFAVTGKSANQVFLIDPSAAYTRPTVITPAGIGPAAVAAVDINLPGNDPALLDLVVASHWNSPPTANRRHFLQSLGSGITAAATASTPQRIERASRVRLAAGGPEVLAAFLRGGSDEFRVSDSTNPAFPTLGSVTGLTPGTDFVHSRFLAGAFSQFVFFVPGAPGIAVSAWNGGALSALAPKSVGPEPVRSVHLFHDGTRAGIAVIYNDGGHASLFVFNTAGDLVPTGSVVPPAGEKLKGILGTSNGRFSALSGPPGMGSTTTTPHHHDGTSWVAGAATPMPGLTAVAPRANVFLYDKEPLVNRDAKLVETLQVPDWSSTFAIVLSTGSGPDALRFTVESFAGQAAGLDNPVILDVPQLPVTGASTQALLNQNLPEASVSTASPALGTVPVQISIDPPAGTYTRHVTPRLLVPDPAGIAAFYRTSLSNPWIPYVFGSTIAPPGDTLTPFTIWFYAGNSSSGQRSVIRRADYAFAGEPGTLDSDGDGVPDFVEIQSGLDPRAGPDSDDDGMGDLEELLLGSDPANGAETATYGANVLDLPPSRTNDGDGDGHSDFAEWAAGSDPFDPLSVPSAGSLVEYRNTFDLNLRPLSHSGTAGTQPDRESFRVGHPVFSPTDIRVHDPGGRLLAAAPTRFHAPAALPTPYASLPGIPATGRDLFVLASTPSSFDCEQDAGLPGWGRELIGLIPIPTLDAGPVTFVATGVSTAAEWIAAARAHYGSLPRATVSAPLDLRDTLIYLLWERVVGLKLEERGILTSPLPLGLATFRDVADGSSQTATAGQLLELQSYPSTAGSAYLLQAIEAAIRAEIETPSHPRSVALRKLANEIYRISAALNDTAPGSYPSPFETLRAVIRGLPTESAGVDGLIPLPGDGSPPASYAAAHGLTPAELAQADQALIHLLGLLVPRDVSTFAATVTATSFLSPVPVLADSATAGGLRLFDADGNPFIFPPSFDLPVGTTLEIVAFTDRADLPTGDGLAVETISATITGFPDGSAGDANQNAIDDAYEDYFFGGPVDPFGDFDGDGYINLQESLDGTHPGNPSSTPDAMPLPRSMPPVRITRSGGNLTFTLEFPGEYGDRIHFLLQSSGAGLSAPFVEGSQAASAAGSSLYTLTIPTPSSPRRFFRFRLGLR
jgi:hypothetical protein